ncbi:MAG: polymer-forming cytoskeletal protein [Odoribacteraceae bacterium]|jgi:cytoskeletal protein CcmA (bactofilin family)|nr:polymer-forming cytoskeletal protein [Odoribacteraceae bacterium]
MGKEIQQVALNLLSEGTQIVGDILATNDIRIDGTIKGNIKTSGRVVIGPTAKVEGNIESPGVDLIGLMQGNITSSGLVSLREKSMFLGNITTVQVAIEAGAIFNGECHIAQEHSKAKNNS